MKCLKCESEWISKTSVVKNCPFCGADLYYETAEDGNKVFDNTAEALAYIYKKHGTEILLSEKLSSYLTDYVPDMSVSVKRLMKYFYDVGAAELIKKSINGSEEDKLEAVKKSISRLIENFIDSQMAESITYEFSDALGWKINSSSEISVPVGFANHEPEIQPLPQNEAEVQYCANFNNKTTYYESLNVGDTFDFGRYNGKPIKWKILRKGNNSIYIISAEELCRKQFHNKRSSESNNWTNSYIRRWLNETFYNIAFAENEKEKIGTVESDKVTLLSKEEAENLMTEQERAIGSWWWLRSAYPYVSSDVWNICNDGTLGIDYICYEGGVRPALNLKFFNRPSETFLPIGTASYEQKVRSLSQDEAEVQYHSAFNNKMTYYGSLNVGDTFKFGRFNGKEIEWRVLSKTDSSMYVISTEILCKRMFRADSDAVDANVWEKSDIRKWLNGEFYSNAFTENEKEKIGTVESDRVTLLSKEEAESLMTEQERGMYGSCWWLRSAYPDYYSYVVWDVYSNGTLLFLNVGAEGGVRPALNLKF